MKKIIKIEGMRCKHCEQRVEETLKQVENVNKVKVNLKKKEAIVVSKVPLDSTMLKETVTKLGYEVTEIIEK